jgi:hypothetical protein
VLISILPDTISEGRGRLPLFHLDHEKSLAVGGQIVGSDGRARYISWTRKQHAPVADGEASDSLDIYRPHLILPSIEELFAILQP